MQVTVINLFPGARIAHAGVRSVALGEDLPHEHAVAPHVAQGRILTYKTPKIYIVLKNIFIFFMR